MISVLQSDIRKAFDEQIIRLLPKMGLTQDDVAWPNAKFTPDPNRPYLSMYLLPGQTIQSTLGQDCLVKMVGVYQISIFQPKDIGIGGAETIASLILNEFPLGRVLDVCSYWVVVNSVYCGAAMQDEDRLLLPVTLAYHCHAPQKQNPAP